MNALTTRILESIYRHAERTYPNECCGFVFADGQVHEGKNIQDESMRFDEVKFGRRCRRPTCGEADCYVLGGVVLGATGISGNLQGKRHPSVGNRVQIGAFARIFGNIVIGDDVFIAPHCVIKDDIAANSVVTLRSELQVTQRRLPILEPMEIPR
jgi:hypothetical protein